MNTILADMHHVVLCIQTIFQLLYHSITISTSVSLSTFLQFVSVNIIFRLCYPISLFSYAAKTCHKREPIIFISPHYSCVRLMGLQFTWIQRCTQTFHSSKMTLGAGAMMTYRHGNTFMHYWYFSVSSGRFLSQGVRTAALWFFVVVRIANHSSWKLKPRLYYLTHCGRVAHICVGELYHHWVR